MLGYLPKPYDDELLYSVAARYRIHLKLSGFAVASHLFNRKCKAIVDLPHSIGFFSDVSFNLLRMLPEEIIRRYTLLPYYTFFVDRAKVEVVTKSLISDNGQIAFPALGISASTVKVPLFLRFCPECVSEDIIKYGETYWRRTHQLPGVFVCTRHRALLSDSPALYRPHGAFEFADATECTKSGLNCHTISNLYLAKLFEVSKLSAEVATGNDDYLSQVDYQQCALDAGYGFGERSINNTSFQDDFISYYDKPLLDMLGCGIDESKKENWLRRFFRGSSRGYHPLQHVLVLHFLSERPKRGNFLPVFGHGPWRCPNPYGEHDDDKPIKKVKVRVRNGIPVASVKCHCGFNFSFKELDSSDPSLPIVYTTFGLGASWVNRAKALHDSGMSRNAIAKELEIDFKTVESLLCDKKEIKSKTVQKCVRTERTKTLTKTVYCSHLSDRVNWSKRDSFFSKRIRAAALQCYDDIPPKRVTIARLVRTANLPASIYRNLYRLTKSSDALNLLSETPVAFQERRLRYVAGKACNEGVPVTRRSLLRLASLEPRASKPLSGRLGSVLEEILYDFR